MYRKNGTYKNIILNQYYFSYALKLKRIKRLNHSLDQARLCKALK